MDDPLQVGSAEPLEPVEVVTVVDAQNVLGGYAASEDARLNAIETDLRSLSLAAQADGGTDGVVLVDETQWETVTAHMDYIKQSLSVQLFLFLLVLVVLSAVLGTRIWSTISEGWRHG